MNKDTAKDYLPFVQALAEGKTIQCMRENVGWIDLESVRFDSCVESYRIKPEPKKQSYRVALYINCKGKYVSSLVDKELDEKFTKKVGFVRWLTDRIEYNLPEGE